MFSGLFDDYQFTCDPCIPINSASVSQPKFLAPKKEENPSYVIGTECPIQSSFDDGSILKWSETHDFAPIEPVVSKFDFKTCVRKLDCCFDASRAMEPDYENAGGKSIISEALSIELFHRWGGFDFVLENEIRYFIKDERVGVSVTRAMGWPTAGHFQMQNARKLLRKKLYGLIIARDCVVERHGFSKSVLHIWCQNERIAILVLMAYFELRIGADVDTYDEICLLLVRDVHLIPLDDFRCKVNLYR